MQTGYLFGGWAMGVSALVAAEKLAAGQTGEFYTRKIGTASFYGARILPRCNAHSAAILNAGSALSDYDLAWL
jgi:acyl-CoA dehydrogenase